MPIAAVLFDLDNTLYPPASGFMNAFDQRITTYVEKLLGVSHEEASTLRNYYYTTYGTTLRGLQQAHTVDIEDYLAFVHDVAASDYLSPDPTLDQLLSELPARKAIFTNSPREHAERVLETLGIAQHFERIFDIRYLGFMPKPAMIGYTRALADLGVEPQQTVFLEDTAKNLEPARQLGMSTILVADQPPPQHAADVVVPNVHAALEVLLDWQRQAKR